MIAKIIMIPDKSQVKLYLRGIILGRPEYKDICEYSIKRSLISAEGHKNTKSICMGLTGTIAFRNAMGGYDLLVNPIDYKIVEEKLQKDIARYGSIENAVSNEKYYLFYLDEKQKRELAGILISESDEIWFRKEMKNCKSFSCLYRSGSIAESYMKKVHFLLDMGVKIDEIRPVYLSDLRNIVITQFEDYAVISRKEMLNLLDGAIDGLRSKEK